MSAKGVAKHRTSSTTAGWVERAACRGTNVNLWFPENVGVQPSRQQKEILALCRSCPVQAECLEHALRNNEFGIWGGLNQTQRQNLRRSRG